MAIVKITLPGLVNTSLQAKQIDVNIGTSNVDNGAWDIIYFTRIDGSSGKQSSKVYRLGKCINVVQMEQTRNNFSYSVFVEADAKAQTPSNGDFIFFGKENKINISGVRGYYAEVEMKNDSSSAAKLFSVGSEMTQSSK
tara:strand:- start:851 stop:1267 length:417 start_codon:yes stop_codon:yes gene_type:complete